MQPLADILPGIVASEDQLLLLKRALARADVVVEDGTRGHKGFVLKPDVRTVKFRIFTDRCIVSGLSEFNAMRSFQIWRGHGCYIHDPEIRKPSFAFEKNKMRLENLGGCEHDFRPVGNNLAPGFAP